MRNNGGARAEKLSDFRFMVDQNVMLASMEIIGQILTQARALPSLEQ